jgi:hypothetical protein
MKELKLIRTFKDLFNFLRVYQHPLGIIDWLNDRWIGKDKQESLLRLFSKLYLIPKLNKYNICKGNFNLKTIEICDSNRDIFYNNKGQLIMLKDKGDSSDLTGINISNSKNILVTTSKNKNKENIGVLGIDPILTHFNTLYNDYTMTLCIVIRDGVEFNTMKNRIENTNSIYINLIEKEDTIIIDWNDLNEAYHNFKLLFRNTDINTILNNNKKSIILKLHQRLGVLKTIMLKNNTKGIKTILWGHIQRSGKSYIMCGSIIEDSKNKDTCNYLVITTAPNETIEQYREVFNCLQLQDFNIICLDGKLNKKPELTNKNIIICSKQFLQNKIENNVKISNKFTPFSWLKKMNFEMRFLDETHNGGTTELAQKTLEYYGKNSFTVNITATYSKPINDYNIPRENWILWDLEDIKLCKNINKEESIKRLIEKHGEEFRNIINQYSTQNIIDEYLKYPELILLTYELKPEILYEIIRDTTNNEYGWSTESCFLLKQGVELNLDTGKQTIITIEEFQNEQENLKMWYNIFGKKNKFDIPDEKYPDDIVFIKRIENICKNATINSRFIGDNVEPMIIMTFLPQNNINKISNATIELLEKNNVLPDYDIISINSKTTNNPKQMIEDARTIAKNNNKKGVLVLSGRQCSLGVSITNCDIVLLLNNTMSFDMIYQMMFRCMTEGVNKKCGFVVDLNIHRVIETSIINYGSLIKPDIHPRESTKYLLQERLINLNPDHWMPCFGNNISKINSLVENVYNIYSSNTENALTNLLDRLRFKENVFTKDENKIFYAMFSNTEHTKEEKEILEKIIEKIIGENNIKKGIEKTLVDGNNDPNGGDQDITDDTNEGETQENRKKINYEDVIKHIIKLVCLLSIHNDDTTLIEMYNFIENDPSVFDILIDQTKNWWGENITSKNVKMFINVYIEYIKEDRETIQIIRTIKELFTKNMNNSDKLSKLIDKYIIPQALEKKQNAEVTTPYNLRQEMLNTIPIDFWTTPKKVFEPCAGKGGFLLDIISRFMNGLKELVLDDKERYRIIVEECLYWSDINPTNIFICKLLLDPYNEYKLLFNEGNTLELDIKEKWEGLVGFDAVIGNPPYNNELWSDFTFFSINNINEYGYLLQVHPCNWRKPLHKIGTIMKSYDIKYLKIYNIKDTSKLFNCNVRVDWYLLQKNNTDILTIIDDDMNKIYNINIKNLDFIPNNNLEIIRKVILKNSVKKLEIVRSHKIISNSKNLKINKDEIYKYKVLTNLNSTEQRIKYTNKPHELYNIPKVLMSYSLNLYPFYDDCLSPTEHVFYQIVKNEEEGLRLISYLESKLFKIILNASKWIGYQTDHKLFNYLPNIIDEIEIINDEEINKYFNINI